jgi:hypothetical protein
LLYEHPLWMLKHPFVRNVCLFRSPFKLFVMQN